MAFLLRETMKNFFNLAIQGWGAAGRARAHACETLDSIQLAGIISRRPESSTLSLDQALQDPLIQAIAISTENTHHAPAVRQALEAGKHVLCDYPLSPQASEAKALYDLAREKKIILHVEHLALLTQAHQSLKKELKASASLKELHYRFQGGWNEKWADPNYRGPLALVAYPRLMQIADWLGPFKIISHQLSENKNQAKIELHLQLNSGEVLHFLEERRVGLQRQRSFTTKSGQEEIHWDGGPIESGLFAKDLQCFYERVQTGKPAYYEESLSLKVLEELEKI